MRQLKNNTVIEKYKHFKEKERYQLEVLLIKKIKVSEISRLLRKHKSTIYREIERGKIERLTSELDKKIEYRANVAERRYRENVLNRERSLKIDKDHELADQ
jgi:IS30 family transposase